MRDAAPQTIHLSDYTPFGYLVDSVHLTFDLHPTKTRVTSRIALKPNPDAADKTFFLHGEHLTLIDARIDGETITPDVTDKGLTAPAPDAPFLFEATVEISPETNTALEGLYMSNGMYCTQCEAEGFRRITYYPDRPDVMSVFTVDINGPHRVLLSNGNPTEIEQHTATWHDPWPKPAYLFALVAGELIAHTDEFITMSGKHVDLNLYVRPGDEGKCAFGMQALKQSMAWDETVYGREYDLDVFNIVAVDDFNMGAMENKGLNIFNSSAVLASAETSTDMNFERIEAIIAHEYFHNWTGNRITCRDWFQLCLKEGLTVYRDSQFTSDMRSPSVKRISDVIDLRGRQFPEDQGPLAHPVRPESFQEINNFYTATVYEKGAELIGMLKTLVGDEDYYKALKLYFDRHDGDAATIEDWLQVFEETTGRDLSQFKRWYGQAGTPHLKCEESFEDGALTLTFTQNTPPSAATPDPQPVVIPIAVGLISEDGTEVQDTTVLEMTETTQSFTFDGLNSRPKASVLRGFSAPVVLAHDTDADFLLAHDTDPFNRWEAGRTLALATLTDMITKDATPSSSYLDGTHAVLRDDALDPATKTLMMALPGQSELAAHLHTLGHTPDPMAIWQASETLKQTRATQYEDTLERLHADCQVTEPFAPTAEQAGKRSLGGVTLSLLTRLDGGAKAASQYAKADNMTLQLSALGQLLSAGKGKDETQAFYDQWKDDRLVIDKWFGLQIIQASPDMTVKTAAKLTKHKDFNMKNPNRFRAALGALAMHHAGFHAADGSGYKLLADWLIKLDPVNPQTTARMCSAFQTWKRYDSSRQGHIQAQLARIMDSPALSGDTSEMISRIQSA